MAARREKNFNGPAQQYFPKGTDLSVHNDAHVTAVVQELNTRPRKGLGDRTPQDRFRAETRAAHPEQHSPRRPP